MCLYPRIMPNPKYKETKKNGGVIPAVLDKRAKAIPVGCQKCMECVKQRARGWQLRLLEEIKERKNGKFITLTLSNDSIWELIQEIKKPIIGYELDNGIATIAVRRWLERWRKTHKKSLRHWLVTELGHQGTENIHLHGIVWTDEGRQEIDRTWKYGYIWPRSERQWARGYVNNRTVNYVMKYVMKIDQKHREYKSIILTSPGIGGNYTESTRALDNRYKGKNTNEAYRTENGKKIAMPPYWRNKIYTDEEREKLWLQQLDKNERWVGGERVDISEGMEEYWNLLDYYREKNERLGYGTNEINWERQEYEKQRRMIMIEERIKNIRNK